MTTQILLKKLLKQEKVTITHIAEKYGYDRVHLTRQLNGEWPIPSDRMEAILQECGYELEFAKTIKE